ncbi:DUF4844 domain-containing protein [Flavobacterium album]|uniref:DUF4844 domain-containing protein n=1 Tax=Flavobacterium album TaxID=2175091 RepID=A0A2S1QY33_9FLAO|nr:DUF4844 domain-containing protein [Flavobacterium album]AWH85249.1 DUF4844 domain-containing protein [Flavobacterium album]
MKKLCLILLITLCACGQAQIVNPPDIMDKFEKFKQKEKFTEDLQMHYPGVRDVKMRPVLSEKINQAADDFREIAKSPNPTDKKYQEKIKTGLDRFSGIYLDTEDRERVCSYFEELMDIVGLESSDGLLMDFMYK